MSATACCDHSLQWHHETRGCGYHGFVTGDRCPCLLPFDEALSEALAGAWDEGWRERHDCPVALRTPYYQTRRNPYRNDEPADPCGLYLLSGHYCMRPAGHEATDGRVPRHQSTGMAND